LDGVSCTREGDGGHEPVRATADHRRASHAPSVPRKQTGDRCDPAGETIKEMNESQGPTPTGTSRPYRSLSDALRAHRIPAENHEFIGAISAAVGVTSFIDRGRYIEALRRDGAPLH